MPEPTLYLFDGHNLFHAGEYEDLRQLRDELASFVALKGARGVLVFDGSGADESYSSDVAVRGTSGQEVQKRSSATFLGDMEAVSHSEDRPHHLRDTLDPETRAKLERMRRGG